ncbi:MAG: FAD-dependent oxidoreductase, partial [Stenotrophobium sp.]
MSASENSSNWDQQFDVIVVGSGACGMTAALCAQAQGLSALVVEKADLYGGTSAVSGGGIWIPCSDEHQKAGAHDSFDEALTYLKHLIGNEVPEDRLRAYLKNGPEMVRFLNQEYGVRYQSVQRYPDYYPDRPGGKDGFRSMEPADFDASQLGAEFERQREPYKGTLLMGRVAMTQVEAQKLFSRGPGWIWLTLKMMLKYWFDFSWRRRTWRDRRLVLGQGMVSALRYAMM